MAEIDVQVYEGRKQFKYNFSSANSSFHVKTLLLEKLLTLVLGPHIIYFANETKTGITQN